MRLVTFGENPRAEVRAENVALNFRDTAFQLAWKDGSMPVQSPLIGRYNVSNLLAAAATALALGRDPMVFMRRIREFKGVPGRMERIEEGQLFNVLVDYAHTDDALRNALGMLRAITPGRLLVVFGCGGNRDRTKRPRMVAGRPGSGRLRLRDGRQPEGGVPRADFFGHEGGSNRTGEDLLGRGPQARDQPRPRRGEGRRLPPHRGQGPRVLPGARGHGHTLRRPAGRAGADRDQGAQDLMPSFDPDVLAAWTGGAWSARPASGPGGFSVDSRHASRPASASWRSRRSGAMGTTFSARP